ncbi:ADP-ribosylation factor-like protein 2 [Pancytospora philotis]|nr:ADP-ribosylation factor-like protein 2 [Pancytospora philotis]
MPFARVVRSAQRARKNVKILVLGLDNAGKTTVLRRYLQRELAAAPTFGYNVHTVQREDCVITLVDVGGQSQFREYWGNYAADASAVVFVLDCTDTRSISEYLRDALRLQLPVVVFCNKCDLDPSFEPAFLESLPVSRVFLTSAASGCGINEGFEWVLGETAALR